MMRLILFLMVASVGFAASPPPMQFNFATTNTSPALTNIIQSISGGGGGGGSGTAITNYINVQDYSVTGDGITDDTAALQALIYAQSTNGNHALFFPNGLYKITDSIDCTGVGGAEPNYDAIRFIGESTDGTIIFGGTNDLPMLDFTGSRYVTMSDMTVAAFSTHSNYPTCGILLGRIDTDNGGADSKFDRVRVFGTFKVAGVFSLASEIVHWNDCRFASQDAPEAYANFYHARTTNSYYGPVTSKFRTITTDGLGGNSINFFTGCSFNNYNQLAPARAMGANFVTEYPQALTFLNCFGYVGGGITNQFIVRDTHAVDLTFIGTRFEWVQADQPYFWLSGSNTIKGLYIQGSQMPPIVADTGSSIHGLYWIGSDWNVTNTATTIKVLDVDVIEDSKFFVTDESGNLPGWEKNDGIYHVRTRSERNDWGGIPPMRLSGAATNTSKYFFTSGAEDNAVIGTTKGGIELNNVPSDFGRLSEILFSVGQTPTPVFRYAGISGVYSNFGPDVAGGDLIFSTRPAGGSNLLERVRIRSDGTMTAQNFITPTNTPADGMSLMASSAASTKWATASGAGDVVQAELADATNSIYAAILAGDNIFTGTSNRFVQSLYAGSMFAPYFINPKTGAGSGAGEAWGYAFEYGPSPGYAVLNQASSAYQPAGGIEWVANNDTFLYGPNRVVLGTGTDATNGVAIQSGNLTAGGILTAANFITPTNAPSDGMSLMASSATTTKWDTAAGAGDVVQAELISSTNLSQAAAVELARLYTLASTNTTLTDATNRAWNATIAATNTVLTDATNKAKAYGDATFLPLSGGTVSGAVLTTSTTTNGPAYNEFVSAEWARQLLVNGRIGYITTNIGGGTIKGQTSFLYSNAIPQTFVRTYPTITANQYLGAVAITNLSAGMSIQGPIVVSTYLSIPSGGGRLATIKAEIYYSYDDGTTPLGDWDCAGQAVTPGVTNRYDYVIAVPYTTFTNTATVYRIFKVVSQSATPTLTVAGGTDFPGQISWNLAGSATVVDVTAGGQNNFTGSNYFSGAVNIAGPLTASIGAVQVTNAGNLIYSNAATARVDMSTNAANATNLVLRSSSGIILGDSTVAAYSGQIGVDRYLTNGASFAQSEIVTNIAVPGHTIAQQLTAYLGVGNKDTFDYAVIQIGLNDLDPAESAATAIARYQNLINAIRTNSKPNVRISVGAMIPCYSRLVALYAPGATALQKWADVNAAVMGSGPNAITNVDFRTDQHVVTLADGNTNLAALFDTGDGIHPNALGRTLIAQSWANMLHRAGFIIGQPPKLQDNFWVESGTKIFSTRLSQVAVATNSFNSTNLYNANLPVPTNSPAIGSIAQATSASTAAWANGWLTNGLNTGVITMGIATFTNITGSITLGEVAGIDSTRWQNGVVVVTNSTSTDYSVTLPATIELATNNFCLGQVCWVTNKSKVHIAVAYGFGGTNAAAVRWPKK